MVLFAALVTACALAAVVIFQLENGARDTRAQVCGLAAAQHTTLPGCPAP